MHITYPAHADSPARPAHYSLMMLMQTMFAAIDADESGTVEWNELLNFIINALEHAEVEAYIATGAAHAAAALQDASEED